MSNFAQTLDEIVNYLNARVPFIILDTEERERAERILRRAAEKVKAEIMYYTDSRQVRSLPKGGVPINVDRDPMPFLEKTFKNHRGAIFALGDTRRLDEGTAYGREMLNLVYLARENSCSLIVITSDPVWYRLAQTGMLVKLDRPDGEERRARISEFIGKYSSKYKIEWNRADEQRAAALLRGFSEAQIENVLSTALIRSGGLNHGSLKELAAQKSRLYAAVPSIQEIEVRQEQTVAGLENLKRWLKAKQRIFYMPGETLAEYDLQPPRGLLLVGVPGCGKSLSARMTAAAWELPLFRFDPGSVYDKYVGESEKKMREALQFLDNVSPCIVWVDEIEKALAVSDGGSDAGKRVLGEFLFWLQESKSRVFLVATANDIHALPPELFRKGRFSEIFFVDLPNRKERAEALCHYCEGSLQWVPRGEILDRLTDVCKDYTYADIEYAVKSIAEERLLQPGLNVTIELLEERFRRIVPYAKTNAETLQRLRAWGAERAVNASDDQEV